MVTSADPDWSIINAFARRVSGMVSVGLKAVEFVKSGGEIYQKV